MSSDHLIAEPDSAVALGSSEQRVEMLRRVTDLFLEGLVVACKAAGLSWQTTVIILRNSFPGITPSLQQTDEAHATFNSLSLSAVKKAIRFRAVRTTAGKTA